MWKPWYVETNIIVQMNNSQNESRVGQNVHVWWACCHTSSAGWSVHDRLSRRYYHLYLWLQCIDDLSGNGSSRGSRVNFVLESVKTTVVALGPTTRGSPPVPAPVTGSLWCLCAVFVGGRELATDEQLSPLSSDTVSFMRFNEQADTPGPACSSGRLTVPFSALLAAASCET